MSDSVPSQLDPRDLLQLLDVARKLAQPFELNDLLTEIIDAGRHVLRADRGTVFLYDAPNRELTSAVATGVDEIRFSIDLGIAGECARERKIVNVPDCYVDERFNQDIDKATGYRTNCLITVPLVGLDNELVGVVQLLNAEKGRFDEDDERMATLLASQAAAAIQRVRLNNERLVKLKLEGDLDIARNIQMGVLPDTLPDLSGYEMASFARPADQTGGDIYDVVEFGEQRALMLLADATGHGIGPALSVTSVRAMLRVGLRISQQLDDLFTHINDQLCDDLPANRFVTALLGVLDAKAHRVEYQAAGQGPLLHYHRSTGECEWRGANTVPWGIMDGVPLDPPEVLTLEPGDFWVLLTDGFYEAADPQGEQLGKERIGQIVHELRDASAQTVVDAMVKEVDTFAAGEPQADDLTALVVKRAGA